MDNNSDKISKKIKALLDKTVENGCSEQEALIAAEKAQQLLNKYNLTLSEIEFKSSEFVTLSIDTGKKKRDHMYNLLNAIGFFTDCKVVITSGGYTNYEKNSIKYSFFGEKASTELANFTFDLLQRAIDVEVSQYKKSSDYLYSKKSKENPYGIAAMTLTSSFKQGLVKRLSQRLKEMKRAQESQNIQEQDIQLYDKLEIVKAKYTDLFGEIGIEKNNTAKNINFTAYMDGREAAEKINIVPGLKAEDKETLKLN